MARTICRIENGKFTKAPETAEQKRAGKRNMEEILAARKAPGYNGGDDALFGFYGTLAKQCGSEFGAEMLVQQARAHGYNPGANDVYMPSVARFVGDPAAFIAPGEGRAKLKETIEKNFGTESEGWVNTKARQREGSTLPKPGLAEDLVDDIVQERIAENPELAMGDLGELRYNVEQDHGRAQSQLGDINAK